MVSAPIHAAEAEDKAAALIAKMTHEEKIATTLAGALAEAVEAK